MFFLLAWPTLFWVFALLYHWRVTPLVSHYFKTLGTTLGIALLIALPLGAVFLGVRVLIRRQSRPWGVTGVAGGLLFTTLFCTLILADMASRTFGEKPPLNPTTPRPLPDMSGVPVFPGAEGFGTRTPAGRGGKVIEVTNLNDSGPGSLRAAVATPGKRIIVFRVSGTIEAKTFVSINEPYVTIAGQTAPGDGICIKNAGIVVTTHDVLVQHLRIRPGNEGDVRPEDNDPVTILGMNGKPEGAHHVVIDHVSGSWGEDELFSVWQGAHDVTFSWCILSEALDKSRHQKGTHSAGMLMGYHSYNVTAHHNLQAHNSFRHPHISDGGTHDIVNNVSYNYRDTAASVYDLKSNSFVNFVGNIWRPGPDTSESMPEIVINYQKGKTGIPKLYLFDNRGPHRPSNDMPQWSLSSIEWGMEPPTEAFKSAEPFPAPPVTASPAEEAYEPVLAGAGATRPRRDAVDHRVVNDVRQKTGRIINDPDDVGGYPKLESTEPPADSDHDGMPDAWEEQNNLDPHDPADGNLDMDNDGYTNVEEYLHSLL